ncbi:MAG: hypothetical protein HY649_07415 [Acidobacteria bacterium]|nr:hypothetical protein [Acidobacteriota bacterium]
MVEKTGRGLLALPAPRHLGKTFPPVPKQQGFGALKYFSLFCFAPCYTEQVFEEVGLRENIQSYRLLPAQLTPSNSR